MIVDFHMHLGDILNENGGRIITSNVNYPNSLNIQRFEEDILSFQVNAFFQKIFDFFDDNYTVSVQKRIASGTLINLVEHFKQLMIWNAELGLSDGKAFCCCMPVAPYVRYSDVLAASSIDKRILPFTSIDVSLPFTDAIKSLEKDIQNAYGLKLHPIIQGKRFNDKLTLCCLEVLRNSGKPVLFHAGASRYYVGSQKYRQHCEYDSIQDAKEMITSFPDINFVIGHAGIAEYKEWASEFAKYDNVFCDGSVQSSIHLKDIYNLYGEDRLLFATDWPCVRSTATINAYKKAFTKKKIEKITSTNAVNLLGGNLRM